ncbi:MAG TPA: flagellar assembly protein FliW [Treponema sp.]|nr:flagellar assembly protein FliW [Treponema sp.]
MDIKTKTMGIKTVEQKQIVTFPEGLFGFEEYKRYAIIESEYNPFIWLQSLDDEKLAFLIVDPFVICTDYEADIDDESLAKIGVKSPEDVIVMAILTIPTDGSHITANLQGPIIINKKNNLCEQIILSDNKWTTKHDIINALKTREGK